MTDGTSQGLFVVVALVIFGLFVSLSYTLFGKTLQPQVVSMFEQGTEQAKDDLKVGTVIPVTKIYKLDQTQSMEVLEETDNSIVYSTDGSSKWGDGIYISSENLEPQKRYKLSYDLTAIKGNLLKIGGHITVSNHVSAYLNGINFPLTESSSYIRGIPYNFKENETVHVELEFKTDTIIKDENGNNKVDTDNPSNRDMNIYIQPNRNVETQEPLTVKIENVEFITM